MNTRQPHHEPDDCQPLKLAIERGEVRMAARVRGQYPGASLETGRLPGIRTVGYWDAVGPQSWGLPMHLNEGIEICYLLQGETAFATDHEAHHLRPGDITITRPWQRHRLGDPNIRPCRMFWVILDVESKKGGSHWQFPDWIGPDVESRTELLRIFRAHQGCHFADKEKSLEPIIRETCLILDGKHPLETACLATCINHLMLKVAQILGTEAPSPANDPFGWNHTIRGFFQGLEANVEIAARPWSVSDMARSCRVGVTYFNHACRDLFNTTPSDHLCRIRLAHAARMLLAEETRSVTEIAFAVGFNSSQYFATRFRRQFGHTPGGYRK